MLHVHCIVQHWNVRPFEHNDNRDAQQELGWRRAGNAELQRMRNYREEPARRCFLRMLHSIATRSQRHAKGLQGSCDGYWDWFLRLANIMTQQDSQQDSTWDSRQESRQDPYSNSHQNEFLSIIHIRLHSSMHKSSHSSTQSGIRSWIQSRIHRIRRRSQQLMKSRRHSLNPRPWRLVSDLWKLKLINVFLK